ncbi:MAG TPA: hypothetical protein VKY85_18755 [Candidatus Angelobacter sp.]|nr:hypothetical protein [Candidatus Angelobacter sp.]
MKVILKRVLLAALVLLCLTYAGDYLQIRYRAWRNGQPYGTVTIQIMYALSEKGGQGVNRTEYQSGGTQDQTCVNSLFPHLGYAPCWYLRRTPQKTIDI